jgi:hypothetical protein
MPAAWARRWPGAGAADHAAEGQQPGGRRLGHPRRGRRHPARAARRRRAAGHPGARLGRGLRRPRAAGAPRARADRRRRGHAGRDAPRGRGRARGGRLRTRSALEAKEGLALLNGTQLSTALALEGLFRAETLLGTAITAGALSVEGLAGSYTPFDDRIHAARGLPPQREVAARFRAPADRQRDPLQPRGLRPRAGSLRRALHAAGLRRRRSDAGACARVLEAEANGVSDNPLVFGEDVLSGGNFHAAPSASSRTSWRSPSRNSAACRSAASTCWRAG